MIFLLFYIYFKLFEVCLSHFIINKLFKVILLILWVNLLIYFLKESWNWRNMLLSVLSSNKFDKNSVFKNLGIFFLFRTQLKNLRFTLFNFTLSKRVLWGRKIINVIKNLNFQLQFSNWTLTNHLTKMWN